MNGNESSRNMARQGFREGVNVDVLLKREKETCPRCGEEIHPESSTCYICGGVAHSPSRNGPGIAPRTTPLALASLILSSLSFLIVPGLTAIAFGHVALAKIRKDPVRLKGGPLTRAGLLIAYVGTGLGLFFLVFYGFPRFLRYRETIRENRAIQSIQILNIALQTYAETYGKGFPESLSQLGPPPAGARLDSSTAGLVRPSLASGRDSEYNFTYTITGRDRRGHPAAYTINANPAKSSASGERQFFFTDQNQLIHKAQFHAASIESPLIVADSAESVELH